MRLAHAAHHTVDSDRNFIHRFTRFTLLPPSPGFFKLLILRIIRDLPAPFRALRRSSYPLIWSASALFLPSHCTLRRSSYPLIQRPSARFGALLTRSFRILQRLHHIDLPVLPCHHPSYQQRNAKRQQYRDRKRQRPGHELHFVLSCQR